MIFQQWQCIFTQTQETRAAPQEDRILRHLLQEKEGKIKRLQKELAEEQAHSRRLGLALAMKIGVHASLPYYELSLLKKGAIITCIAVQFLLGFSEAASEPQWRRPGTSSEEHLLAEPPSFEGIELLGKILVYKFISSFDHAYPCIKFCLEDSPSRLVEEVPKSPVPSTSYTGKF